jgi:hypothetical protein
VLARISAGAAGARHAVAAVNTIAKTERMQEA